MEALHTTTAPLSPAAPRADPDDVAGFCDDRALVGSAFPTALTPPGVVPAVPGSGDRLDGGPDPSPPVLDAATLAVWRCQLLPAAVEPSTSTGP